MSDRRCLTSEFLRTTQTGPELQRMCTAISALPLARIAVAGAESIHVMKVAAEVCPLCEGTGWKSVANGSDRRVTRCDCRVQARSEALLKAARIPKRYEHCELSNFDYEGPHQALFPARMAACKFVEEYQVDNNGLLLIGTNVVGKTHLAVGILQTLILSKVF